MAPTATQTFPARYAAALAGLRTAKLHTKPLDADLVARLIAHNPEAYAACEAKVAAIAATIPALQATVDALEAQACRRCTGTGVYAAPSSRLRNGVPYCFTCGGSGQHS